MDPRTLGEIRLVKDAQKIKFLQTLGPEPFAISSSDWFDFLQKSKSPIKSFLLDQRKIAGLGNIYACEALFLAAIDPKRPSNSLRKEEAKRLLEEIKFLLKEAIKNKGTTISDYRDAQGRQGKMQFKLRVYQRQNKPCFVCGNAIQRQIISGRSSYFCPHCQK